MNTPPMSGKQAPRKKLFAGILEDRDGSSSAKTGSHDSPARRKLAFCKLPFQDEHVYLDLPGYKDLEQLEQDLQNLGASIDKFLIQQTTCVITNKKQNKNQSGSSKMLQFTSPNLLSSRGRALLQKSNTSNVSAASTGSDVITMAKKRGLRIVPLKEVLKIIKKESGRDDLAGPVKDLNTRTRVRNLIGSFIKVEDLGNIYKPEIGRFKAFPCAFDVNDFIKNCDNESSSNEKPVKQEHSKSNNKCVSKADFTDENVKTNKGESVSLSKTAQSCHVTKSKNLSIDKELKPAKKKSKNAANKTKDKQKDQKRKGYCELCDSWYYNLKEHSKSLVHLEFVRNEENFNVLENTINKLPTLDQLFYQFVKKTDSEVSTAVSPKKSSHSSPVLREISPNIIRTNNHDQKFTKHETKSTDCESKCIKSDLNMHKLSQSPVHELPVLEKAPSLVELNHEEKEMPVLLPSVSVEKTNTSACEFSVDSQLKQKNTTCKKTGIVEVNVEVENLDPIPVQKDHSLSNYSTSVISQSVSNSTPFESLTNGQQLTFNFASFLQPEKNNKIYSVLMPVNLSSADAEEQNKENVPCVESEPEVINEECVSLQSCAELVTGVNSVLDNAMSPHPYCANLTTASSSQNMDLSDNNTPKPSFKKSLSTGSESSKSIVNDVKLFDLSETTQSIINSPSHVLSRTKSKPDPMKEDMMYSSSLHSQRSLVDKLDDVINKIVGGDSESSETRFPRSDSSHVDRVESDSIESWISQYHEACSTLNEDGATEAFTFNQDMDVAFIEEENDTTPVPSPVKNSPVFTDLTNVVQPGNIENFHCVRKYLTLDVNDNRVNQENLSEKITCDTFVKSDNSGNKLVFNNDAKLEDNLDVEADGDADVTIGAEDEALIEETAPQIEHQANVQFDTGTPKLQPFPKGVTSPDSSELDSIPKTKWKLKQASKCSGNLKLKLNKRASASPYTPDDADSVDQWVASPTTGLKLKLFRKKPSTPLTDLKKKQQWSIAKSGGSKLVIKSTGGGNARRHRKRIANEITDSPTAENDRFPKRRRLCFDGMYTETVLGF